MQSITEFAGASYWKFCVMMALSLVWAPPVDAQFAERTVIDNPRGGFYTYPQDVLSWRALGCSVGRANYRFDLMDPEAIKGIHGRLQHFEQIPETFENSYFPTPALQEYEADEVGQGRPPLWCTATWQGRSRKLVWEWHLKDFGMSQPVNVADERLVDFFVNNYCRGILNQRQYPHWWVGVDNFTFDYSLYGVLDDANQFVPGVVWDQPFPQDNDEWMQAAVTCLDEMARMAPDLRIIANEARFPSEEFHQKVFARIAGVIFENFLGYGDKDHIGEIIRHCRTTYAEHVQVFQFQAVDPDDPIRIARNFCAYLIAAGPNGFCNMLDRDSREIDPMLYADLQNRLGASVSAGVDLQEPGQNPGHQLHSRQLQGGMVYFNRTGTQQTLDLPAGQNWYDRNDQPVTTLTLADETTAFVTTQPGRRCAVPRINPRRPEAVCGPLKVTITLDPPHPRAIIRYSLDGSTPTPRSPVYRQPLVLRDSCTVKAACFEEGRLDSFVNSATYEVTRQEPSIAFHLPAESQSEFLAQRFPLVALSHLSGAPVKVNWQVTGGTARPVDDFRQTRGTLTFPPGERYRFFPLQIVDDSDRESDETIEITLSNPSNAVLGEQSRYTYTIQDND